MPKTRVAIVTADRNIIKACRSELPKDAFEIETHLTNNVESPADYKERLIRVVNSIIGIESGSIAVKAVIVDAVFVSGGTEVSVLDNIFEFLPPDAGSIVSTFLGSGIGMFVNLNLGGKLLEDVSLTVWRLGHLGVRIFNKTSLVSDMNYFLRALPYNDATLHRQNDFAPHYDEKELGGAATVSAILWENEFVLKHIKQHIEGKKEKVRILDLGCGTGRFEEIILSDFSIEKKVERIFAVDFAPRYIAQARKRLKKLLHSDQMNKIVFLRRLAEDLRFPEGYFDIVVAGFGIMCFSQTHKTLPCIYNVMKLGGLVTFNGYNRKAITHEFDSAMERLTGRKASHFAISINREDNTMKLGGQEIDCFTFDPDDALALLSLVGFKPIKDAESKRTFPALYGTARKDYLSQLSQPQVAHHPRVNPTSERVASYQKENLCDDIYESGFNYILHLIDEDLSHFLEDKGFYFCIAAHKKLARMLDLKTLYLVDLIRSTVYD